ncbi:hypothetical protein O2N63_09635 [Aliiroseovarius sp. KMU-50]|uniref:DUF995 domain-containing protein n=1 Tax=Aliiroseovarius salicola TaxID=3009082 RepID=A0ABT4W1G0_9RHOB|nr:hypothetical protein [Aliiroseovarius sp. KMU-50]MDA5094346.1 hypothetical protein [Aliiroseovarius sp. KMU-50]
MRYHALLTLLLMLPGLALAQNWTTRPTDQLIEQVALDNWVRGKVLNYYDGGTSDFRENGQYFYTYGGGGTWEGEFEVGTDSTICVTYVTGQTRCDLYVQSGDRLTVITEEGLRFPIKEISLR